VPQVSFFRARRSDSELRKPVSGMSMGAVLGQVETLHERPPDSSVNDERYFLVASQSGTDRRLGRQYVNGSVSARQPVGLPGCQ
jgi:hypothetical protein